MRGSFYLGENKAWLFVNSGCRRVTIGATVGGERAEDL
jgi:hypothetical protein